MSDDIPIAESTLDAQGAAEAAAHLHSHFDDPPQQHATSVFGMWVFLASELLVFGAIFTGYAAYRNLYPQAFDIASARLNLLIGGINTIILLTSSLTMALGVQAAHLGRRRLLVGLLAATALLGTAFMALKALEYYLDYRESLMPGVAFEPQTWSAQGVRPEEVKLFLLFYYLLTLLHALHLTIGIVILVILAVAAARGAYSTGYYTPIEVFGLYWHFVDVIWIFLLPLLYLIGTRTHWT